MKSKIFLLVFIAILAAALYFSFGIIRDRYINEGDSESTTLMEKYYQEEGAGETVNDSEELSSDNEMENNIAIEIDETEYFDIEKVNYCNDECENFTESLEKDKCLRICGFIPGEKRENEIECDKLNELEKDFCLRDFAVTKRNFKTCEKIEDKDIREACKNRVIEEILDESIIKQ